MLPVSTACDYGADPFATRIDAALAAVNASRTLQLAVNKKIEDEYKSIEPMEVASRMQQWMMSNPQEAIKYMQGVQTVGEDYNAKAPAINAAAKHFKAEEDDHIKRYQAALKTAYAPGQAHHNALKTKIGTSLEYPSVKDPATPGWAMAEEDAIMGTPSASRKTTSAEESVIKYLETDQRLFAQRREQPSCNAGACAHF